MTNYVIYIFLFRLDHSFLHVIVNSHGCEIHLALLTFDVNFLWYFQKFMRQHKFVMLIVVKLVDNQK